jgi:outer membrane translocation and assembly module TamA
MTERLDRSTDRRPPGASLWMLLVVVALAATACGRAPAATGPIPRQQELAGREVARITFAGDLRIPADSLRAVIMTREPRCRVPLLPRAICPGFALDRYRLDMLELSRDVARMQLYYRDHGYYATRVVPNLDPMPRERVEVRFAIVPGDQVILRELSIRGTEGIIDPERLLRQIPLRADAPFRRVQFLASADTIRAELLRRGYAGASVLRNYEIDTATDFAGVEYEAIPGPLVRIDSVVVLGANRLGDRVVRRMLTFREDDLLRVTDLNSSQRNLYGLGMVNFASVEVAPVPMQRDPEADSTASVLVRVVEAPQYMVDATAGYGTVDCFRTGASWTNRNFLGGARRLEVAGNVSKLGVGWPAAGGLETSLCRALIDDEFSDTLNYRIGADFQQPRLFGTQNRLGVGVRALRASELQTYMRRAVGGQIAVSRDLGARTLLSTTVDVERGATRAAPAVFCVAFDICSPEVFTELQRARWSNALNDEPGPRPHHDRRTAVRGWAVRGGAAWASPAFGSDDEFLRAQRRGARPPGAAARLGARRTAPGRRLSCSAASTRAAPSSRRTAASTPAVRTACAASRATRSAPSSTSRSPRRRSGRPWIRRGRVGRQRGGRHLVPRAAPPPAAPASSLGSVELRTPSPVFSEMMRLGFFVDGGQVWAPGDRCRADPAHAGLRAALHHARRADPGRCRLQPVRHRARAALLLVDEHEQPPVARRRDFPDRPFSTSP